MDGGEKAVQDFLCRGGEDVAAAHRKFAGRLGARLRRNCCAAPSVPTTITAIMAITKCLEGTSSPGRPILMSN